MSTPVEKFTKFGTAIQSDWSEQSNALTSPEKDLWAGMSRQPAYLHAVFLSGQGADLISRHVSMYNRLYADIHELSYPFSVSGSTSALEEPENVPNKPEMPPSVKQNLNNDGLPPKLPIKYTAGPIAVGQTALPSVPAPEDDNNSLNSRDESMENTKKSILAELVSRDSTGKNNRRNTVAAGEGDELSQAPAEREPHNKLNSPYNPPGNPESEKFMEIRGWGQLGNFLQGDESDNPGIFFPKEEGLPDHGSPYLAEKNNTEDKDPEKYSSSAVSIGSFSNDLQRATVEGAAEEPAIQELQKQPPSELDFDEWFTEMQWRLNLEFKRYYGR